MKHIFKYSLGCLLWVVISVVMVSCSDDNDSSDLYSAIYPGSVEMIIPTELQQLIYTEKDTEARVLPLIKGEVIKFGHIITPENITFKKVIWSSSNQDIVKVDQEGTTTAISGDGVGYSIIQVAPEIYYSGSNIYSTLKIVVSNMLVPAQSISITSTSDEVFAGETLQLSTSVFPEDATYKTYKWTSSDEDVAVVDSKGLVTAKSTNAAFTPVIITATSLDGAEVVGTKTIFVKEIIEPQDIAIDQKHSVDNNFRCAFNENLKLEVTLVPADATQSLIKWTSSDENIAKVEGGLVIFNKNAIFGDVTITATCPETNNSSSIKLRLDAGLVRELFYDQNNYTWYNAEQSSGTTSSSHVWEYGKITVTTYGATTQRADLKCWSPKTYLHAGNYPIFAIRMDDLIDMPGVNSRNITFDGSGECNGNKFSGGLNGSNNKWLHDYKCSDGSHVFIYNLNTQGWATGGILPTDAIAEFTTFQFKYADIKGIDNQLTYNVYWVQTFKTIDDVKSYIASEGLTYEIIK